MMRRRRPGPGRGGRGGKGGRAESGDRGLRTGRLPDRVVAGCRRAGRLRVRRCLRRSGGWRRRRGRRGRGLRRLGLHRRNGRGRPVEPVQVVELHDRDQVGPVVRVGRVDAGEVVRERVRDRAVRHRPGVVAARRQQLGMVGD
jgi:hypothetical protein